MAVEPYRVLVIVLGVTAVLAALLPAALTYRHYGNAPWFFALALGPAIVGLALALQTLVIDYLWQRILGSSTGRRLERWERVALALLMSVALSAAAWFVAYLIRWDVQP